MPNTRGQVQRDSKYEYTDKLTGKALKFTPVADELVATFNETSPAKAVTAMRSVNDSSLYLIAPEKGFAVLRTNSADKATAAFVTDVRCWLNRVTFH